MKEKTRHDGDCTIYSSLINGRPEDGICVCGYGWQLVGDGDRSEMYSRELQVNLMKKAHPQMYDGVYKRETQRNPNISEENIMSIFEKELEEKAEKDIACVLGGKE